MAAATDSSNTSQQDKKPKEGAESARIGWAFLSQYYSFLNKDPSRLHCFYTKRSTLIHSTEGDDVSPCYGQQEIHTKIMSLQFEDCKVYISNVDSQSSAEGGIIVQVIGEMSNADGPWRKFAQTFFLAEQPNGYFVLNDICRFMKEEGDEEQVQQQEQPAQAPSTASGQDQALEQPTTSFVAPGEPFIPSPSPFPSSEFNSLNTPAPPPGAIPSSKGPTIHPSADASNNFHPFSPTSDVPPISTGTSTITPNGLYNGTSSLANGSSSAPKEKEEEVEEKEPESVAVSESTESVSAPVEPAPVEEEKNEVEPVAAPAPSPVPAPKAAPEPVVEAPKPVATESAAPVASTSTSTPAAAPVSTPTPAPAAPAGPKTWASLAATGSNKWGAAAVATKSVSSAAAPAPAEPSNHAGNSKGDSTASGSGSRYPPSVMSLTSASCFVKGVVETVDADVLKKTIVSKYGNLKEFDVIRNKACAFLEFERLDGARRAITASMHRNDGGGGGLYIERADGEGRDLIHIVSKKPAGERPVSSGRTGKGSGGHGGAKEEGGQGGKKSGKTGGGGAGNSGGRGQRAGQGAGKGAGGNGGAGAGAGGAPKQ